MILLHVCQYGSESKGPDVIGKRSDEEGACFLQKVKGVMHHALQSGCEHRTDMVGGRQNIIGGCVLRTYDKQTSCLSVSSSALIRYPR